MNVFNSSNPDNGTQGQKVFIKLREKWFENPVIF